ncbi:MAG: hypothetical protein ACI9N9_000021 [Enterobacterales bacterium]|jgi:hypothetical protein
MGLTKLEQEIIDLTVKLWSALIELPEQHKDDIHEARRDVHNIQNRIAARPTWRSTNED